MPFSAWAMSCSAQAMALYDQTTLFCLCGCNGDVQYPFLLSTIASKILFLLCMLAYRRWASTTHWLWRQHVPQCAPYPVSGNLMHQSSLRHRPLRCPLLSCAIVLVRFQCSSYAKFLVCFHSKFQLSAYAKLQPNVHAKLQLRAHTKYCPGMSCSVPVWPTYQVPAQLLCQAQVQFT